MTDVRTNEEQAGVVERIRIYAEHIATVRQDTEQLRASSSRTSADFDWLISTVFGLSADLERAQGALAAYARPHAVQLYLDIVDPQTSRVMQTRWQELPPHHPARCYFAYAAEKQALIDARAAARSSRFVAAPQSRAN